MPLVGSLSYMDVSHLFKVVGTSKKSGELEITCEQRWARLYFQAGRLIRAESNQKYTGIGTLLVEAKLLAPADLDRALELQRADGEGRRLGAILCDNFHVDCRDIERLLAVQFQQIVFDVFSWPTGAFTFEFTDPEDVLDRFHLNPSEFMLAVGLKAGFLAQEGEELEQAGSVRLTGLCLVGHPALRDLLQARFRRLGSRVLLFDVPGELVERLEDWASVGPAPVVVLDHALAPGGDLPGLVESVCDACPTAKVITMGSESAPGGCTVRHVVRPDDGELDGATRADVMEVLGVAVEQVLREAGVGGEGVVPTP